MIQLYLCEGIVCLQSQGNNSVEVKGSTKSGHQVKMGKTHLLSLLLSPPLSFYFAPALWEQGLFLPLCLHVAVKGSSLMDFLLQQTSMNNNCNNNAGQKWKMKAIEDCIREGSFLEDQPFSPVPQMVGLTCVSQGLCAVTKS